MKRFAISLACLCLAGCLNLDELSSTYRRDGGADALDRPFSATDAGELAQVDTGHAVDAMPIATEDLAHVDATPVHCGGYVSHKIAGCWYVGALGGSCDTACAAHGGFDGASAPHTGAPILGALFPGSTMGDEARAAALEVLTDQGVVYPASGGSVDGTTAASVWRLACPCLR